MFIKRRISYVWLQLKHILINLIFQHFLTIFKPFYVLTVGVIHTHKKINSLRIRITARVNIKTHWPNTFLIK